MFISLTTATVATGFPGWTGTLGVSLAVSAGLIIAPRARSWLRAHVRRIGRSLIIEVLMA